MNPQNPNQPPTNNPSLEQQISPFGGDSLGGFVSNIGSDIGNLWNGIKSIPQDIGNIVNNPNSIPSDIGNIAQGTAQEIGRVLPVSMVKPIPNSNFELPGFNPAKTVQAFYNKPVSTTLDALTLKNIGDMADAAKAPPPPTNDAPGGLTQAGNRSLLGQYKLNPTQAAKLDALGTVNKLADWGLTDPSKIADAADGLTGETGILNNMVEQGVSQAGPVELGDYVNDSGNTVSGINDSITGGQGLASQTMKNYDLIPESAKNNALDVVKNGISNLSDKFTNGELPTVGTGVQADPNDVLDFSRQLDSRAAQYLGSADVGTKQLGQFYASMADELQNRLFNVAGANVNIQGLLTPDNINAISQYSPQLAQEASQATSLPDLRSLQAPLVKGSQMVEQTATKMAGVPFGLKQLAETYIASQTPAGLPLLLADTNMGKNLIGNALRGAQGVVNGVSDLNPAIKAATSALPVGASILGSATNGTSSPIPKNNTQNNNQNSSVDHTGSISQNINSSPYSAIKPDSTTGKIELPQTPPTGARQYMSLNDYKNQLATLSSTYTAGTPAYNAAKTQLDAEFQGDQTQANEVFQGNNVKNFMDNAVSYSQDGQALQDTLTALPTAFWNGVQQVGTIEKYTDPAYANEVQQIANFDNEFTSAYKSVTGESPTADQLVGTADSPTQAATKYLAEMQFIAGTYGKYLSPYLGLTSATANQTNQGNVESLPITPPQLPGNPTQLPTNMLSAVRPGQ